MKAALIPGTSAAARPALSLSILLSRKNIIKAVCWLLSPSLPSAVAELKILLTYCGSDGNILGDGVGEEERIIETGGESSVLANF